eukprot:evm.model.scf_270.2 EVM.evm.TU.scf_270.2   scf_270:14831-23300(+)
MAFTPRKLQWSPVVFQGGRPLMRGEMDRRSEKCTKRELNMLTNSPEFKAWLKGKQRFRSSPFYGGLAGIAWFILYLALAAGVVACGFVVVSAIAVSSGRFGQCRLLDSIVSEEAADRCRVHNEVWFPEQVAELRSNLLEAVQTVMKENEKLKRELKTAQGKIRHVTDLLESKTSAYQLELEGRLDLERQLADAQDETKRVESERQHVGKTLGQCKNLLQQQEDSLTGCQSMVSKLQLELEDERARSGQAAVGWTLGTVAAADLVERILADCQGMTRKFCSIWNDLGLVGVGWICAAVVVCFYSRDATTLQMELNQIRSQMQQPGSRFT